MSTLHDKNRKRRNSWLSTSDSNGISFSENTSLKNIDSSEDEHSMTKPIPYKDSSLTSDLSKLGQTTHNINELQQYLKNADHALSMVDDVVTKQYLNKLESLNILPVSKLEIGKNILLYKINRMVYEKDEFVTDKFISALSAMTYANCSVFLILDGYKDHTDFYLGIRNNDENKEDRSVGETFKSSLHGQFPGIILEDCSIIEMGEHSSDQQRLLHKIKEATSISSCVGVPSYKDEDGNYTNTTYVQGIEKLALAMQGRRYTAVILATNLTPSVISGVRQGYEDLYTQLSAISTQQIAYSTNESLANALSRSKGVSDGINESVTKGTSHTDSQNHSHTTNESVSQKSGWAKAGSIIGGALMAVGGAALMATGIGIPAGVALAGLGAGGALAGAGASGKQKTKGFSDTEGESTSDTTSENITNGTNHTETFTETDGTTATIQSGKNFTLTLHNKHVEELQKRIDKQLERIDLCESTGLWSAASYFFSYENDLASAETGAAIFKSIMQGEKSGVESSAVNTWYGNSNQGSDHTLVQLNNSICSFTHPLFEYQKTEFSSSFPIENSSLINSKELAMLLSLPRKSVPGLPVIEHISLGKEVVRHGDKEIKKPIDLGCIFDQGVERPEIKVELDAKSLTQHVFVTGSTGSGKSETVYKLIDEAKHIGVKFLIIEPAKGEYKNVFGNVNVFGTNPDLSDLLRINPFRFPKGIHVLEHIDRLTEIFNVCWPMYAAMPAVLKKAIIVSYEKAGWDLVNNQNDYGNLFPTFKDLLFELENVIKDSAYSEEVKGNYIGSLVMRVESLTNGLNGLIFDSEEIGDKVLFDENTIVDLSRIGSQETKALIMGILVMRLSEYRMVNAFGANSELKHITVLEEAHNILKRTSTEQSMEGSNVTGKAVEMITNSIAEMRTYGEGFIIVDQSPTSVDPAAIKNTNTKIIMRLPDGEDRKIAGKSAGMKDNQVDEIAKLPTGVGITYQNDWEEPVMCKVQMKGTANIPFVFNHTERERMEPNHLKDILSFLLAGRNKKNFNFDIEVIEKAIHSNHFSTAQKIELSKLINEYKQTKELKIWEVKNYDNLSKIVADLTGLKNKIRIVTNMSKSWEDLDETLKREVETKIGEIPTELNFLVRHALMKDFSYEGETPERIYTSWDRNVKSKL